MQEVLSGDIMVANDEAPPISNLLFLHSNTSLLPDCPEVTDPRGTSRDRSYMLRCERSLIGQSDATQAQTLQFREPTRHETRYGMQSKLV